MESEVTQADLIKLDESFKQDGDRWVDSYVNNNASTLHQRAVANLTATNGNHSTK